MKGRLLVCTYVRDAYFTNMHYVSLFGNDSCFHVGSAHKTPNVIKILAHLNGLVMLIKQLLVRSLSSK